MPERVSNAKNNSRKISSESTTLRAIWKGLILRLNHGEFDDLIGFRLPFRNLFIVAVDSFLIKQMKLIDDRGS